MKIRSKLVLTLLPLFLTALITVMLIGTNAMREVLTVETLKHLASVASIQKHRIDAIVEQNMERVKLVTSRTQLRNRMLKMEEAPDKENMLRINKILKDAKLSIDSFKSISAASLSGFIVASTETALMGENVSQDESFRKGLMAHQAIALHIDKASGVIQFELSGPLRLDGVVVGVILIEANVNNVLAAVHDYSGLGDSGETVLARRDKNGDAVFLMPLRFDQNAALTRRIVKGARNISIMPAVNNQKSHFREVVDYRGIEVFAVTEYIPSTNWGMVVKIDKEEALAPIRSILRLFLVSIFFVCIVVIIGTVYFSSRLTNPILKLTNVARNIRDGDFHSRAETDREDETGELAVTFNQMTEQLQHLENSNQEKIRELKAEVSERIQTQIALTDSNVRYQAVLSTLVDALITIDHKGVVISFNQAAENMFGYPAEDVVGNNITMLMPDSYSNRHDQYLQDYHATKQNHIFGKLRELKGKRRGGALFPIEISVAEMRIGGESQYSGIIRDITERKQIEKAKSEFVSTINHELRTPLTSIKGFLGLLVGGAVGDINPKVMDILNLASKNVDRLTELINDLLDMEKIQSGRMNLRLRRMDVEDMLVQAVAVNEGYASKYEVTLSYAPSLPSPFYIHADSNRILQVMSNLLSNAIKHSPKGGTVKITLHVTQQHVQISVTDHGEGVPDGFRDHVFSKFMQADSSDSRKMGGTGLGLAISKSIVEMHGGKIDFESSEGEGARFFFTIPARQVLESRQRPVPAS